MPHGLARGRTLDIGHHGIETLPPYDGGRIDPRAWFAEPALPLEIEIGCGKGTFLVREAEARPAVNYLGIEKAGAFFRHAADRMRRRGLENVRILRADASEFLRYWCADGVAAAVHLQFSDPWPKARHHKRRVMQDRTLAELYRVLVPAGSVHLVTDHPDLWAWYQDHAQRHETLFERRAFDPAGSGTGGELVGTNYERKYRREGRPFHAMTLVKRA